MLLASLVLLAWVAIALPSTFGWHWLAALSVYPLIVLICWPLSTIMAYVGTRYRDVPNALTLLFQAVWFVSHVYFLDSMLQSSLPPDADGAGALARRRVA